MTSNLIFKSYLYKSLVQDLYKFARKQMKQIDGEDLMHKMGLARYQPGKAAAGGLSLLLVGGLIGAVVALALAPKSGEELRTDVKDRAQKWIDQANAKADEIAAKAETKIESKINKETSRPLA
jgi:hypothetical protein